MLTFGVIVKNGMPFVKYSLGCVYDLNCEIIIVDGGSTDGTIEYIEGLEDIDNKITLIKGVWADKVEQCNEYMKRAKGEWVWQLDSDEIYNKSDLLNTVSFLTTVTNEDVLCIPILNFWHNLNTCVVGGLWSEAPVRIFRHKVGDLYISHRPPTVQRDNGKVVKSMGYTLYTATIYHYSHIGIERVRAKAEYYAENLKSHPMYSKYMEWFENTYIGWLENNKMKGLHITGEGESIQFTGAHPEVIQEAIERGELKSFCK